MKVTNHDKRHPRVVGGVMIPVGGTREVPNWDRVVAAPPVARLVENGTLSVEGGKALDDAKGGDDAEKKALIDELEKLGVKKTQRSSLESLQKALDEAKAKQ